MGFDEAEHHVDALVAQLMRLFEHPVGLADAGRGADVNLEPPLSLLGDQVEERLRRGTLLSHTGKSIYARRGAVFSAAWRGHPVKRQVKLQHIDARLAEQSGEARPHVVVHHVEHHGPR